VVDLPCGPVLLGLPPPVGLVLQPVNTSRPATTRLDHNVFIASSFRVRAMRDRQAGPALGALPRPCLSRAVASGAAARHPSHPPWMAQVLESNCCATRRTRCAKAVANVVFKPERFFP